MKTCLLVSKSDIGGATVYVHNLKENIELETDLIYLYRGNSLNQIEYRGKHISNKERLGIIHFPGLIKNIVKELKARNYDLINVHSTEASIILRLSLLFLRRKPKIVYTLHGWGWRGFNTYKSFLIKFIEYCLSKLISTTYVFLYKKMRDECSFISEIKYETIPTGIERPKDLREYKLQKDRFPTFLFPARVDRAKNHSSALKIFVPFQKHNLRLVFVGSKTDSDDFRNKIKIEQSILGLSNLKIEFKGVSRNMKEQYLSTDFVLLLSHFEALPLTIIEALSYGIPCIVSDVGGNRYLINNQINGVVTTKNNELDKKGIDFISNCLSNSDFYKEACFKAFKKFDDDLNIESMASKYQDLFHRVMEGNMT